MVRARWVSGRVLHAGWVSGWVYRVGNTGSQALPSSRARKSPVQRSGPRSLLQGGGVGGTGDWARVLVYGGRGRLYPHPSGPVGPLQALPGIYPRNAHLGPIRRDSTSFPRKLVKTAKCHRKVSKRPVIVPILQNGSEKSPLDFLRFPFITAFSHKELMGGFDPTSGLYVKMTKCRHCAHPRI